MLLCHILRLFKCWRLRQYIRGQCVDESQYVRVRTELSSAPASRLRGANWPGGRLHLGIAAATRASGIDGLGRGE